MLVAPEKNLKPTIGCTTEPCASNHGQPGGIPAMEPSAKPKFFPRNGEVAAPGWLETVGFAWRNPKLTKLSKEENKNPRKERKGLASSDMDSRVRHDPLVVLINSLFTSPSPLIRNYAFTFAFALHIHH
jgi:hypothetical protein